MNKCRVLLRPANIVRFARRRNRRTSLNSCTAGGRDPSPSSARNIIQNGWYGQLGGDVSPLVDAILDRIVHDAYMIDIIPVDSSKDISMREVYGLKESDCM